MREDVTTEASLVARMEAVPVREHVPVTGGSGYVGSHVAHRLQEDGRDTVVLDTLETAPARPSRMRNSWSGTFLTQPSRTRSFGDSR